MLLAANRTGGQVRTDFSVFPTPEFARVGETADLHIVAFAWQSDSLTR